jgi:hypothetical protein
MNDNPDTVPCTPTPADSGSNAASGTSDRRWRMAICTGTLLVAAFLLFWNLGSYSSVSMASERLIVLCSDQ